MAQYRALYRKYRPQVFGAVVGQGHITETLAHEVKAGQVAHAYLFAGPRGTGKTSTARILAKSLNCLDRKDDGEPCNVCDSCVAITEGTSMDVIELDAASHNKVEDVREIRANVGTVASVGGARRVYILDEAHMLSRAAANALLKTLEEPPEHAHFVLATTEPYKLPDTIRSRAQRFDFHPIGAEALVDHLGGVAGAEEIQASEEALEMIARHAAGSARDALGLLEQVAALGDGTVTPSGVSRVLGLAGDEAYEKLVSSVAGEDAVGALALIAELTAGGVDLRRFVSDAMELFRGLFLVHYAPNVEEVVDESADRVAEWRRLGNILGASDVLRCIDRLGEALSDLREGREERLVVELAVLQMCRPETAVDTASLLTRLERLEERMRRTRDAPEAESNPGPATAPAPAKTDVVVVLPEVEEATTPEPQSAEHQDLETPMAEDLSLADVETAWPSVVARIRDEAGPRRYALFREVTPVAVEGATVTLEVPGNLPFHLAQLGEDDALNGIVRSVIADAVGGAVKLDYQPGGPGVAPMPKPEQPTRAPDRETLEEAGEGGIDPAKLVAEALDGEVVE